MSKVDELPSCPFCGGKARLHDYALIEGTGPEFVERERCGVAVEDKAAWNRRATPSECGDGALREALAKYPILPSEHNHIEVSAAREALRQGFIAGYRAALALPAAAGWQDIRTAAVSLLASLDPETLNPEQFNAFCALEALCTSKTGGDPASTGAEERS